VSVTFNLFSILIDQQRLDVMTFYSSILLRITIPKRVRTFMWIFSLTVGFFSMYYVTLFYLPDYRYSEVESALYNSLHRLGWAIFTGWLVLGCVTSTGNPLKSFFNASFLIPLSRLTYCAYLTNGFIELYLAASVRTSKYMSIPSLVRRNEKHSCLTNSLSLSFHHTDWRDALARFSHLFRRSHSVFDVRVADSWH
jgi:hypothetical protein